MKTHFQINGIFPALIASLTSSGELDLEGIKLNTNYLIDKGVAGLLINGSTGEAAALTRDEKIKVLETVIKTANGRIKIIAGTGAPSTAETIRNSMDAKSVGADAVLIITPFYIIPTQDGLIQHYQQINDTVKHPIIMYNLPAHTGVDIQMDTLDKLADLEYVCGLKESSGRGSYIAEALLRTGDRLSILEGGDDVVFPSLCMGVSGSIVALGNIAPDELVGIYNAIKSGKYDIARQLYFQILPIARAISVSVSFPAGVKLAVAMLGRPAGPTRSPITALSTDEQKMIREALITSKLLKK
jgi:4-hydroxy-tetrahydrodipicolinate synthase